MNMGFEVRQQAGLGQQQKLSPRMIQSMEILQMPIQALQERNDQELESNIALEVDEHLAGQEREVTSDHIGRRALEELSEIDVLAAVRFASVFQDFSSPADYEAFFQELSAGGHGTDSDSGGGPVRSLGIRG